MLMVSILGVARMLQIYYLFYTESKPEFVKISMRITEKQSGSQPCQFLLPAFDCLQNFSALRVC